MILLKHVERPYCILKGTVLQLQKSADISLQIIKLVYQRFHSITPFISRDMCNKQKLVTHGMLSVILKMFHYIVPCKLVLILFTTKGWLAEVTLLTGFVIQHGIIRHFINIEFEEYFCLARKQANPLTKRLTRKINRTISNKHRTGRGY